MIYIFLIGWVVSAFFIVVEQRIARLLIHLGVFSFVSSACFLFLAAPDVAMAQVVISVFTTIIFIVSFEKFYAAAGSKYKIRKIRFKSTSIIKVILPVIFVAGLVFLFILFIPDEAFNAALRDQFLARFAEDVGGQNAVTAIYLGYRMYDTLIEALMLLAAILAVIFLSRHEELSVSEGKPSDIRQSGVSVVTIRLIFPLIVLFCVYLVMNGHLSPGGGFQGGVVAASLFVCRYLIHDIYDMPTQRILTLEKIMFVSIFLLAMLFVFVGLKEHFPMLQNIYLIAMNCLIGLKVACGFYMIFYRFIAVERR